MLCDIVWIESSNSKCSATPCGRYALCTNVCVCRNDLMEFHVDGRCLRECILLTQLFQLFSMFRNARITLVNSHYNARLIQSTLIFTADSRVARSSSDCGKDHTFTSFKIENSFSSSQINGLDWKIDLRRIVCVCVDDQTLLLLPVAGWSRGLQHFTSDFLTERYMTTDTLPNT